MLLFPEERVKLRGELVDLALALLPVLPLGQDDPAKQDPAAHAEEHPTEEAENDRCCPRLPTALACLGRGNSTRTADLAQGAYRLVLSSYPWSSHRRGKTQQHTTRQCYGQGAVPCPMLHALLLSRRKI